jgi:hypothetical protein
MTDIDKLRGDYEAAEAKAQQIMAEALVGRDDAEIVAQNLGLTLPE